MDELLSELEMYIENTQESMWEIEKAIEKMNGRKQELQVELGRMESLKKKLCFKNCE